MADAGLLLLEGDVSPNKKSWAAAGTSLLKSHRVNRMHLFLSFQKLIQAQNYANKIPVACQ